MMAATADLDWESCRVRGLEKVYYVPNFVSEETAQSLWSNVYQAPKPKWTVLQNRRLQNWGGLPLPKGLVVEAIPDWLACRMKELDDLQVFGQGVRSNHVLVNEYLSGQGIMPHEDGPLFHPVIATITVGSHTILEFYKKRDEVSDDDGTSAEPVASLLLEPNSLVVVKASAYTSLLHGIDMRKCDPISSLQRCANAGACVATIERALKSPSQTLVRDTRLSFTIRNVPKVCRLSIPSLFGKKR